MNEITTALQNLYNNIPRRHSDENIIEINRIVTDAEDILLTIEAENTFYEKNIPEFFDQIEITKSNIKKAMDRKASKKTKDNFMDVAADGLKDTIQDLIAFYDAGIKKE